MNEIKLLILDVDGTLTDGKIYMGENGEIMKAFNAHDAVGVRKLKDYNITPIIITGRISKITENRAKEMYVDEIYQNIDNKLEKLESILKNKNISYKNVAYIGDDENDLECMKKCADSPSGFMLNTGCQLPIGTPKRNVEAFIYAARKYGRGAKMGQLPKGLADV